MATLRRDLGLPEATALVVGSMIGVGIFLGPARIAGLVESPALILLVWLAGGAFILFGALTYAELGSALPQSGGDYAFLREAYGGSVAFAAGWSAFMVGKSASIAALAVGFGEYVDALDPATSLPTWAIRAIALALIASIALVNALGVKHGGRVQLVTTSLKVAALALLVGGGALVLGGNAGSVAAEPALPASAAGAGLLGLFGLALIPAFFAYDGWANSTQVAEEVRDPGRNVPRSLLLGVAAVVAVYTLVNVVYLLALGADGVASSRFAAADSAEAIGEALSPGWGAAGRVAIVVAILVSITGTVNGVILSGPRITFAMARDGLFFRSLSKVSPRFGTPAGAIGATAVWSAILVLLPTPGDQPLFDTLLTYVIFDSFIFYALGAAAVFVLRRKRPDLPRPYRVPGYPVVPAVFVALTVVFLANTAFSLPRESAAGLALVLAGAPFYLYWRSRGPPADARAPEPNRLHPRALSRVTYSMRAPLDAGPLDAEDPRAR